MIRKLIFGLVAGMLLTAGYALAQAPLPPFLNGINTQYTRMMLEGGMFVVDRNSALTATPSGTQATSLQIGRGMNQFTTVATAGDGALLPNYPRGMFIFVVNASANSMNIFPPTGQTINALSANAAYALAAGKSVIFFQAANGQWYANLSA